MMQGLFLLSRSAFFNYVQWALAHITYGAEAKKYKKAKRKYL